ncbi:MAG: MFS transporter, partial [Gammaproteobacteria bacterium]|nr:MFS transporter [Gammaproteobacteria bacterium]
MIEHKSAFRHMVYAWLVIFLCAMFMFYKYIMQISPSVMTSQIMQVFDVKGVGLGNITASFFYSYFITQLFVGLLLDRFGVRALCALAILICALGTFMFAG